ncbi:transcriptional regulator [Methylobacterium sp. J-030]|uniref:helix-turn-helix domain-containing protein n=1 Tax=Methylobacterium sp. J-030 TaxID=2836627 RepID=UPI001FB99523|nr:transcriptional regulator [Methylobacterium sp. J-030]MCJ2071449.1 transcriptional regulator [Methylobacterium sp. J-030]
MTTLVEKAVAHWPHVAPLLTAPANGVEYDRLVQAMDQILSLVGEDEDHPLAVLASRIGDLIEAYDEAHRPMPQVTGAAALHAIMDERGLGQGDLPEVGPRSVVSEILSGKRQIDVRQARALSARFAFPAEMFLDL